MHLTSDPLFQEPHIAVSVRIDMKQLQNGSGSKIFSISLVNLFLPGSDIICNEQFESRR